MSGVLGGGGGLSWGLGNSGRIPTQAQLPSIGGGGPASPGSGGYSLVSANRSARLAGNSPRDVRTHTRGQPLDAFRACSLDLSR